MGMRVIMAVADVVAVIVAIKRAAIRVKHSNIIIDDDNLEIIRAHDELSEGRALLVVQLCHFTDSFKDGFCDRIPNFIQHIFCHLRHGCTLSQVTGPMVNFYRKESKGRAQCIL
jgi:hypothetical protein